MLAAAKCEAPPAQTFLTIFGDFSRFSDCAGGASHFAAANTRTINY